MWVTDIHNNRIQEFSSIGTFIAAYGTAGTGNGQFKEPGDITFSGGNLYVTDSGNNRIQELSTSGTYINQFGTEGSNSGQLKYPEAIAADATGNLYVTDWGNSRIEEFAANGSFLATFGTKGTGEGQFTEPVGIAINPAGDVYIATQVTTVSRSGIRAVKRRMTPRLFTTRPKLNPKFLRAETIQNGPIFRVPPNRPRSPTSPVPPNSR